ncbi:MAG TPA: DUF2075 domain-containing protein [Bacteroidales bacterium]|nr:DUF2075 domain-containing protein [Bacteroidales bacterium]
MLIYQAPSERFVADVRENTISDKMSESYQARLGKSPGKPEFNSWQNSLSRVRDLLEIGNVQDSFVALEYEVPYNQSRLDCLLFGRGANREANVVLIELKQWTDVKPLPEEGNFVETFTGGKERIVPHPSQQVKGYHNYMQGFVEEFEKEPILSLYSCAYCHNYTKQEDKGLYDPVYKKLIGEFPLFTKGDTKALGEKIKELLQAGTGFEIFNRFMQSRLHPSKKLLENVHKIIKNDFSFSLLNEQLVAKNLIWARCRQAAKTQEKSVIIVHGGPGTGKSVIALNILAEAALQKKNVLYGCKSKPFTTGLQKLVGRGSEIMFSNLYRFIPSRTKENEFDILLIDEAHRIEKTSNHQYTKPGDRTDMPQMQQLVRCSKTTVFFIDDRQNVRSSEVGSSALVKEAAAHYNAKTYEVTLETQYRCMGSNDYLLWVESVLGYSDEKRILRKEEQFDFRIFDSPQEIMDALIEKEKEKPNSARMVAGFCWPWSSKLDENGDLVKDVRIGDFAMPWETHDKITNIPKGYVRWYEWAYRTEGIKQVGCIYTAQGFEFDYVGVIIGDDLTVDSNGNLTTNIAATKDPMLKRSPENFDRHVRNIYRTLLTRGMKGCWVCFTNQESKRLFIRRISH